MASDDRTVADETTVNESYAATIPASVRRRIDVEPGDKLRWSVTDDSDLRVEVVKQRYGAWEGAETVRLGELSEAEIDAMGTEIE